MQFTSFPGNITAAWNAPAALSWGLTIPVLLFQAGSQPAFRITIGAARHSQADLAASLLVVCCTL